MANYQFDFSRISTLKDFYVVFQKSLHLNDDFGANLDALWDVLTSGLEKPINFEFINLTLPQLETFDELIAVFESAMDDQENFDFIYTIKKDW